MATQSHNNGAADGGSAGPDPLRTAPLPG
jgi:hypothetical protein